MPASETQEGPRGGKLPTVIFWIGVGLAPLAALLVLIGSGATAPKIAAVLAILAVVLVGLSVMLKPDATSVKVELEETMLDEIDMLRQDVRQDITSAARATHKSFSDKLQLLHENVESLRGQLESVRAAGSDLAEPKQAQASQRATAPAPPSAPPVGSTMVGGGVVRHTETVRETTRQTIVDQNGDAERGTVYGGGGGRQADPVTSPPPSRRAFGGQRGDRESGRRSERDGWAGDRDEGDESWTEQRLRERLAEGRGGARAAGSGTDEYRGGDYRDAGHRGRDEHRGTGHRRDDYQADEHRSDEPRAGGHRGGGHYRDDDEYSGDIRGAEEARRPRRHDRDDPADDPRWSEVRAGDRWAAVRSDEHGRELRMGERRAEMHSDESGTELRIEDRWASVRREEGRRAEGRRGDHQRDAEPAREARGYREEPRASRHESRGRDDGPWGPPDEPRGETRRERREREERWSTEQSGETRPAGRRAAYEDDEPRARAEIPRQRRGSVPALPAASGPPASSLTEGWRDDSAEREPRRRRDEDRDDRWERDDGPRAGGSRTRRVDFELSDDRWR